MAPELIDQGAQAERTSLSWLRTSASITFAGLFVFRQLLVTDKAGLAFTMGGLVLLVVPVILVTATQRIDHASKSWEIDSIFLQRQTLLVALATFASGLLIGLTAIASLPG